MQVVFPLVYMVCVWQVSSSYNNVACNSCNEQHDAANEEEEVPLFVCIYACASNSNEGVYQITDNVHTYTYYKVFYGKTDYTGNNHQAANYASEKSGGDRDFHGV